MKTILCYGDSNTFGAIPGAFEERMVPHQRWPGVLKAQLGEDWLVIEEGLSGRTTVNDDPIEGSFMNGRTYLLPCIYSHKPLDIVAIMLGTNDLKVRFSKTASEIALGLSALVRDIHSGGVGQNGQSPQILIIAPPPIHKDLKGWDSIFENGREKSLKLASELKDVADALGVEFLDAGEFCQLSEVDGFHLDVAGAKKLGLAVSRAVVSMN